MVGSLKLQGKVAIVTGGSRGIGRAIVCRLAGEGAKVVFCARRDDDEARDVLASVAAIGAEAAFVRADITDGTQMGSFVGRVNAHFGQIDILVNNAGTYHWGPFLECDDATTEALIGLNLIGPLNVTRYVLPGMIERRSGKIIFIASDAARAGFANGAVYSASKGGVIALTKSLALEVGPYSINVNCVSPGAIETGLLQREMPQFADSLRRAVPLRRLGKPEDVAAAVAFLASDDASYITGQTLSVSGGSTMSS